MPLRDPCLDHDPATFDRPLLFLPLILVMFASSTLLFLGRQPYGVQLASVIPYTSLVVLTTFSAQRGQQPYFFECFIVRRSLPQLARRHCGFLVAVVLIETFAYQLRPHLPDSWLIARGKGASPSQQFCLSSACASLSFKYLTTAFSSNALT